MPDNISELFCEILSGAVLIIVLVFACDVAGATSLDAVWTMMKARVSLGDIAAVLVVCYLLGLIMDAFGLAIGELFLDDFIDSDVPTQAQRTSFLQTVPEHMLRYRDHQWTYYSAYRNLLLLLVPGAPLASIVAGRRGGVPAAIVVIVAAIVLAWVLWRSMVALLGIYFRLTKVAYAQK